MEIRDAHESDLPRIAEMIADFAKGHKSEHYPRSAENLRAAYFGDGPVAHLLVATGADRVIGMVQWTKFYDAFWSMFGVQGEWLYVRPEARGFAVAAALITEVCARGRRAGASFLRGGALTDDVAHLYERCAIGGPSYECHVSGEAFQVLADLGGKPVREIVRGLPDRELGLVPERPR
ncbi:MAG TPA: GNAT family N-acetyltransferase [Kofleriaceae bacterium]